MHIMVFNVHYKDSTILEMVLDRTFLKKTINSPVNHWGVFV
jgi:hypothetical protein